MMVRPLAAPCGALMFHMLRSASVAKHADIFTLRFDDAGAHDASVAVHEHAGANMASMSAYHRRATQRQPPAQIFRHRCRPPRHVHAADITPLFSEICLHLIHTSYLNAMIAGAWR